MMFLLALLASVCAADDASRMNSNCLDCMMGPGGSRSTCHLECGRRNEIEASRSGNEIEASRMNSNCLDCMMGPGGSRSTCHLECGRRNEIEANEVSRQFGPGKEEAKRSRPDVNSPCWKWGKQCGRSTT